MVSEADKIFDLTDECSGKQKRKEWERMEKRVELVTERMAS